MTTSPNPPVDIEALRKVAEAAKLRMLAYSGDVPVYGRQFGRAFTPTVVLALIAELERLRAAKAPEWKPLLDAAGQLNVDEGATYLFAVELAGGGAWEYFSDSIGWDADEETVPNWHSGAHGWSINNDELFFAPLPAPPEVSK